MGDFPGHTSKSRSGDFIISFFTLLVDALAMEGAFLFSYWLRFSSPVFSQLGYTQEAPPPLRSYLLASLVVIAIWLLLFQSRRMYSARRSVTLADELFGIVKVISLGMLMVATAAFLYREFSFSRIVFFLLWGNAIAFVFAGRGILLWFERKAYARGQHLRQAVIVGNELPAADLYTRLHRHPSFGFQILGYFAEKAAAPGLPLPAEMYLGRIDQAPAFIRSRGVDLAFIALRSKDHQALFEFISECEGMNIDFLMVPDVLDVLTSQMRLTELEGIPLLKIKSVPFTLWGRVLKRTLDLVVSFALLVLLSPFLILIALLIKLDSRGPVFFSQERVGLDGRRFRILKFRSMRTDVDQYDQSLVLGIRRDPRRTRVGIWLRKLSIDETPQLINVLRGEMSLVGPRPERTNYVEKLAERVPRYLDRHRVKTGITGWAQVNGLRGDTSIEERVRYDLYYIENWSVALDMKILLRTIRAALNFKHVD
jgi:exopolysaccharide biosynthesis polyprenyl glycosylphosphotransferase